MMEPGWGSASLAKARPTSTPDGGGRWRWLHRRLFAIVIVVVAFAFCYASVFVLLVRQWSNNDVYSHGFLIPCVSLYVAWIRRGKLTALSSSGNPLGVLLVALSVGVLAMGRLAGITGLQELSIVSTLFGMTLVTLGFGGLRVLWFPISYLLFMIPFWDIFTERLHYPFQVFSAWAGGGLMQALGVPVYRNGTYLFLPTITLEVARVCSGVSYLIAVAAVGVALSYVLLRSYYRRVTLVLVGVVVSVVANPVRIALIGLLAYHDAGTYLHGPAHILQGLFVAGIGYAVLMLGAWALRDGGESPDSTPLHLAGKGIWTASWLGVILTAGILVAGAVRPETRLLSTEVVADLSALPYNLGEWGGHDATASGGVFGSAQLDGTDLYRSYQKPTGEVMALYIRPYGRRTLSDSIDYWPDRFDPLPRHDLIEVAKYGSLAVNRAESGVGAGSSRIVYWYVADGRQLADRRWTKAFLLWARLLRRPVPLVVLVVQPSRGVVPTTEAEVALFDFLGQLLPALREALSR
jgi:exosortase